MQLARLWCRTREEIEPIDGADWTSPAGVDALSDETEQPPEGGAEDADHDVPDLGGGEEPEESPEPLDEIPSWMLAALAGETDGAGDGLTPMEGR